MIEQAIQAFVQEAEEILSDLEEMFLTLEESRSSAQIDEIFRALHTIKGSGSMFAHTALSGFTHHFENAFELVRSGDLEVTDRLIDLSLKARDIMVQFLSLGGDGQEADALTQSPEVCEIISALQGLTGHENTPVEEAPETPRPPAAMQDPEVFGITFRPDTNALRNGMRPDLLVRELSELGDCAVRYNAADIPRLSKLDPDHSYLGWKISLTTSAGREAVDDVFIFADDADLKIECAAPETDETRTKDPEAGPRAKPAPGTSPAPKTRNDTRSESIRVTSSRLDEMMDALGELVIAQARLDSVADAVSDQTLDTVVEEVQRLVMSLRDATLSIRMVPIETVFSKFKRVVRDLSAELGKDVRLVIEGGATEVDKNIIDRIGDPLVHMIRNSIDHGLETAPVREATGKLSQGTIWLSARQEGGEILISIEDNGKGLDAEAIRSRATERGLTDPEAELSDAELHQLIFEPGFSTATTVSSVSGRGVGMDAVKTTIDKLGGQVTVISKPGIGTRMTLTLPVTMAIIDGLRVRLGSSVFVIPLSAVEECVEMPADERTCRSGRRILQIRDESVPYLSLDAMFGMPAGDCANQRVVIVRVDGARAGLVVDDILGQSQTVIKSLSAYHRDIPGLGGATILGDGSVALILDVSTLVRWAETDIARSKQKVA